MIHLAVTLKLSLPYKVSKKDIKEWAKKLQDQIALVGGEVELLNVKELKK